MAARPRISRRHLIVGAGTASAAAALLGGAPASALPAALPPNGQLVPISPVRIYDSRVDTTLLPTLFGRQKWHGGDGVAINVGRAYASSPSGYAIAILGNLTITETEGSGFLTMMPEDDTGEGPTAVHSNINWWQSGLTLANSFLTLVGSEHSIVLSCRGGRTHVVIDAFGYVPFVA